MSKREYDFILLGATGYTGKLTAEYITSNLPTSVKWAIAGRSMSKLESLARSLKTLNSDRTQPDILTVELNKSDLDDLVKKTRVILNTIGPYHIYSTPIVEACATSSTHYLDVTGETPWVASIIAKYEKTAKAKSCILIPEIGIESAPSDLIAYTATGLIRRVWDCGVMDMVASVHQLKSSGASGGTLASGLGLMDNFSTTELKKAMTDRFVLAPFPENLPSRPEPTTYERTSLQKFTGVWEYPDLGTLTTSITATPNVAIVQRSAALTPLFYGFNFTYEEYMGVSNALLGTLIHFALVLATFLLAIPPVRFLLKTFVTQPGSGPTVESSQNDVFELRGIAVAEQIAKKPRKALSTFRYQGAGMYHLTAILLAEGAMALLENTDSILRKHGPGFLTPSCLGDAYIERLRKAGVTIQTKQIGDIGSK